MGFRCRTYRTSGFKGGNDKGKASALSGTGSGAGERRKEAKHNGGRSRGGRGNRRKHRGRSPSWLQNTRIRSPAHLPRTSPWRSLAVFLLTCLCQLQHTLLLSHRSLLCEPMDLPCDHHNGCRMKYYKLNSTDCRDMPFDDDRKPADSSLGTVRIESYHYSLKSYRQTGFNLSFTNITWNHLKFRFKQEGNDMKNTCREFHLSPNSSLTSLFYDCLWSNENYEGKTFSFEYQAANSEAVSYRKYSFRVPFAKHISQTTPLPHWEIFTLVETAKNSFGLTTFILHWQPLPARFSTNSYSLKVYSNDSGHDELTHTTNVTCNDWDDCKYHYNKWYGNIQFGIQPICGNESDCFTSKTAVFHLGGENAKPLLIGIVSITAIVPATVYLLYLLRGYLSRKSKKWLCPVPRLLVVFTPSLSCHVNVVFALVEYLKTYCHVEPLLDELDIFRSRSRDPFKWCNEAFKSADAVMVVASPYHKDLRLAGSVYRNTDVLLLRLLRERLAAKDDSTRFFLATLPYSSEKDIPAEAANLRRFAFPGDLNRMLRFIHNDASLADCLSPEVSGGKETYRLLGGRLSAAISEAQSSLRKNRAEYERMVEEMRGEAGGEAGGEAEGEAGGLVRGGEKGPREQRGRGRSRVRELAEGVFGEFPGLVDEMNLSGGEEGERLMGGERASGESDAVDLDVLAL